MAYKLLYIDDEFSKTPESVQTYVDLLQKKSSLEIKAAAPQSFENQIAAIIKETSINAIIIDYRLSIVANVAGTTTNYDAPSLAQELRTKTAEGLFKEIPIFLISSDEKIKRYYDHDEASHDLFDFVIRKDRLAKSPDHTIRVIIAFIDAYIAFKDKWVYEDILKMKDIDKINGSFFDKLSSLKDSPRFPIIKFLYKEFYHYPGLLVNDLYIAARFGINIDESTDFSTLLEKYFGDAFYTGVFATASPRWWWHIVEKTWNEKFSQDKVFLRKSIAQSRVEQIIKITDLKNISVAQKLQYSTSDNFWTVCHATKRPIDPTDGLKLYIKDNFPWQEPMYISIYAALNRLEGFEKIASNEKHRLEAIKKMLNNGE